MGRRRHPTDGRPDHPVVLQPYNSVFLTLTRGRAMVDERYGLLSTVIPECLKGRGDWQRCESRRSDCVSA